MPDKAPSGLELSDVWLSAPQPQPQAGRWPPRAWTEGSPVPQRGAPLCLHVQALCLSHSIFPTGPLQKTEGKDLRKLGEECRPQLSGIALVTSAGTFS